MEKPGVRSVEAVPVEQNGQRMIAINDPDRLVDGSLLVSLPAFYLMTLMDGGRTVEQIRQEFLEQFNQPVSGEDVTTLVNKLDEALLLDNRRYHEHRELVREKFLCAPLRPAGFAGRSYPDNKEELAGNMSALMNKAEPHGRGNVTAMAVPHIDFRVGADMMAEGWREITACEPELVVILGTGHTLSEDFFACIDKDFETPLGVMKVDGGFLEKLAHNFGEDIYGQAMAHRMEHSIEFQALFLALLARSRPSVTAVPILLSFPEMIWKMDHPLFNGARVDRFIDALKKTAVDDGRKIVYVASVDFSHVGARFGDEEELTDARLKEIEKDDKELISALSDMDVERFLEEIMRTNKANRVCGFPALYTLLKVADAKKGELLDYRQNLEGDRDTMVSFATMIFS